MLSEYFWRWQIDGNSDNQLLVILTKLNDGSVDKGDRVNQVLTQIFSLHNHLAVAGVSNGQRLGPVLFLVCCYSGDLVQTLSLAQQLP